MGAHKRPLIGKLVRKNLILDDEAVRLLAQRRGTSESEAVREVIADALRLEEAADQMMDALGELAQRGTLYKSLAQLYPHLAELAEEIVAADEARDREVADAAP